MTAARGMICPMALSLDLTTAGSSAADVERVAQDALRDVQLWGSAGTMDGKINAYTTWATNVSGQLGNVLDRYAVHEWMYDDSYWRTQHMAHDRTMSSEGPSRQMLDREADRRRHQLEALVKEAQQARERWGGSIDLVVLDTNVVMDVFGKPGPDGRPIAEHLPWALKIQLLKDRDLRLVIPWHVLRELDRLKRNTDKELRALARATIGKLNELNVDGETPTKLRPLTVGLDEQNRTNRQRPTLTVEFYVRREDRVTDDADLEIIRAAAHLERISAATVCMASRDINATTRAKVWGVNAFLIETHLPKPPNEV